MTRRPRQLLGVLGACSALALAGCGSPSEEPEGDPLPADAVAQLEIRLDEIERRYQDAVDNGNAGACKDIGSNSIPAVQKIVAGLPDSVDAELRSAVKASFVRLGELAESECADIEPEETVPEAPIPEEPIPEETIPEETVPEETVPEETVPEETIPEEILPPDDGGGGGGGNGGGAEAPPGLGKKD